MPTGDNLFHVPAHVDIMRTRLAGAAELRGSASTLQYALTLENHILIDLFPYVFFFDPRKYDIEVSLMKFCCLLWSTDKPAFKPLYLPPSPVSCPLTCCGTDGSTLGIGYGAQGTDSMSFTLPEGFDHDSAFVKVFVSAVYINMETIVTKAERCPKRVNLHNIQHCWDSWIYLITVQC